MGKDMINEESMIEAEHFIMLDIPDTVSGNEFDRSYPYVQIVFPSNENSYGNEKVSENHPENGLAIRERRKHFCSIALNVDSDY